MRDPKRLIILASGSGSNAEAIMQYFQQSEDVIIGHVITNKKNAGVLARAAKFGINADHVPPKEIDDFLLSLHKANRVDAIILAGFLRKISQRLLMVFPHHILNIHPSLLPKFGGKGMYGKHVHQAVKDAQETQTGITIHVVNAEYDKGKILHQATLAISSSDDSESIGSKVLKLEHFHYPRVISQWLSGLKPPV